MICAASYLILWIHALAFVTGKSSDWFLNSLRDDDIHFPTDRKHVPPFAFVNGRSSAKHRYQRDIRPVSFEVEGQHFQFNLVPSKRSVVDSNIPVWTVESTPNSNPNYTYRPVRLEEVGISNFNFYEDPEKLGVFLPYYHEGYIFYDGIFMNGSRVVTIRSARGSWMLKDKPTDYIKNNHFIYETNTDNAKNVDEDYAKALEYYDLLKLDEPLTTLYPKILVAVDYHYFKKLGQNIAETVKHMALYWNVVDLIFKQIPEPIVNIKLKGIVVATDERAMNYIYSARNEPIGHEFVNISKVLRLANRYFDDTFKIDTGFKDYDMPFVFTSLNSGSVRGLTLTSHICTLGLRAAVIQETKGYGISVTVHELGHAIGLPHDEGENTQDKCFAYPLNSSASTIMAPYLITADHYFWSTCSIRKLKFVATLKSVECLRYPSLVEF